MPSATAGLAPMPTVPDSGRPRSAVQRTAPVFASRAKKLSPSVRLLHANTRPPATAGVHEGGSGPIPRWACQCGTSPVTAATLNVSTGLRLDRDGSCPYIGHSLTAGAEGVGASAGVEDVLQPAPSPARTQRSDGRMRA